MWSVEWEAEAIEWECAHEIDSPIPDIADVVREHDEAEGFEEVPFPFE